MKLHDLMRKNGMFKPVDVTAKTAGNLIFQDINPQQGEQDLVNGCCGQSGCTCNGVCKIDDIDEMSFPIAYGA
ncbi:MAG: hypothetical protein Tsb005_21480 [Gammaproteobacteria bacterium]